MSYDKASVLAAYQKCNTLKGACEATGAPPYIAFIWLKKSGLMTTTDKCKYGTISGKLGAEAEKEFQRLVPKAMSSNSNLQANCPAFDFDINGVTVDVKYCSLRQSSGRFAFKTARDKLMQPDFYVAFLINEPSGNLKKGYQVLVIPHEVVSNKKEIELRPDSVGDLWDFLIEPHKLAEFFDEAAA